ncbi:Hypothetical predicted protein [Mytilus galloprovincialis]|uniref:Uncharacterized protein n=1 Tax=Mytilus galloprovincialis TaxID=29158 RepID=A0A8B6DQZ8_MYTGA|nr:Hypothetical predicted protein [Mytilus galloprovincialis]
MEPTAEWSTNTLPEPLSPLDTPWTSDIVLDYEEESPKQRQKRKNYSDNEIEKTGMKRKKEQNEKRKLYWEKDSKTIDDCVKEFNELLKRRHDPATLIRDLNQYNNDELPCYARIQEASFRPRLWSKETEHFFRERIRDFNKRMRTDLRQSMLQAADDYIIKNNSDCEKLWKKACDKIIDRNNIPKLNNKVQQMKEKWAKKYRNYANM